MDRPAVSVVIPTFNRPEMLREALDSVSAQTFRALETIVVDDGSTEDIEAVVAEHPGHARLLRQSRRGPAAARNRGVSEARADLIAFLDSDDTWLPEKLSRFVGAAAARPEVPIWFGPMRPVDALGRPVEGRTKPCLGGRIARALFESSFVHVPTIVVRRALFDAFGGFDESLPVCEDYDLWLRISVEHEFGLVPAPLAARRLHDDRLSKTDMRRNLIVKANVLERFYESVRSRGVLDDDAAQARLMHVLSAAARACVRAGFYRDACRLLERGRRYGATSWRMWPTGGLARALALTGLDNSNGATGTSAESAEYAVPRSMAAARAT